MTAVTFRFVEVQHRRLHRAQPKRLIEQRLELIISRDGNDGELDPRIRCGENIIPRTVIDSQVRRRRGLSIGIRARAREID